MRLKLVTGYFALAGGTLFAVLLVGSGQAVFGRNAELRAVWAANPLGLLIAAAMAGLHLLVAWQLYHRSRGGAVLAAVLLILPVVSWILGEQVDGVGVVLVVIGLLLIASVWDELRPAASSVARRGRVV